MLSIVKRWCFVNIG